MPAGVFYGRDKRGPYRVKDAEAVITASMAEGKLPLDENHATDHAMSTGAASPARGWIDRMEVRPDGVWGHVDWNDGGRALMSDRAYRGVSPVFTHEKDGAVVRVLRAALTNTPNLAQLATLHATLAAAERDKLAPEMFAFPRLKECPLVDREHTELAWDMVDQVRGATQSERAEARRRILARAKALGMDTGGWTAAHSQGTDMDIAGVRQALGLPDTADEAACLAAMTTTRETVARQTEEIAKAKQTTAPVDQVVALQTQLDTLKAERAREKSTAVIDKAIAEGKPIVPVREQYIALHMADPAKLEAMLAALPSLHAAGRGKDGKFVAANAGGEEGAEAMSEADKAVCAKMGIEPKAFMAHRKKMREEMGTD
ncbi:MAG: phage protease [Acidiphilium sp.]